MKAAAEAEQGRLAWRLAGAVGLAGLVAFAVIATLGVWLEQRALEQRASQAARQRVASIQDSLGAAAWNFDQQALVLLTQSLAREGSIVRVTVADGTTVLVDSAAPDVKNASRRPPSWTVPLLAPTPARQPVAELRVVESYERLHAGFGARLATLVASEALKVALVVALVVGLVHRRFARPLRRLAGDVDRLSLDEAQPALTLHRQRQGPPDELDHLVNIINRLHERLRAELQSRSQAQAESRAAREADRAKSEFLSRMSHELRTPLNAVLGLSDVLLSDTEQPLPDRQRQLVAHVRGAGQHLLILISDLLDLSRIEAGTMVIHASTVPAGPLTNECVELVSAGAQDKGIQVSFCQRGPQPALVSVDPTRCKQVLMNLLSNAIKYNRPGGTVQVAVDCEAEQVLVSVADTGLGMTEQQLERLFTPFQRVGREHIGVEGTGIGLVIARHLAQMMGGTIACSSKAGAGSVFTLTLPRAQASPPAGAPAGDAPHGAARVQPELHGELIVVEDNEVNRLLLELYLQYRPGVNTRFAADVQGAVALMHARPADLALIDMNLGAHTGHDVLAQLRPLPGGSTLCCVAFSADALPEQVRAVLAAGFDDYWIKPMGLDEFLQRLDQRLARVASVC